VEAEYQYFADSI